MKKNANLLHILAKNDDLARFGALSVECLLQRRLHFLVRTL